MARVAFNRADGLLCAYLSGEIDHHSAQDLRERIDSQLAVLLPDRLILDFAAVTFMDSSGLGLILGRQRRMQSAGGKLVVQHPPQQIKKVLDLAGVAYTAAGGAV